MAEVSTGAVEHRGGLTLPLQEEDLEILHSGGKNLRVLQNGGEGLRVLHSRGEKLKDPLRWRGGSGGLSR